MNLQQKLPAVAALDVGNGYIKAASSAGICIKFPHALRPIDGIEAELIEMRGGNDHPDIYKVDGRYWAIGAQASRTGASAVRYGEQRYTQDYYGVLAAIALFKLFDKPEGAVTIYGSHTPKDIIYRQDLILAIKRAAPWIVEGIGVDGRRQSRSYSIRAAYAADEPAMAYRHAILSDDGTSYRGDVRLRKGICLVIDCGTFTTAFTIVEDGKVDYESARSEIYGVIDLLDALQIALRRNYRVLIKGANAISHDRLERALTTGRYEAGMVGEFDIKNIVNEICYPHVNMILQQINIYGGTANIDSILLAGGGGALQERRLREALSSARIYLAEQDRHKIQFATAWGMLKTLRAAAAHGKLKIG